MNDANAVNDIELLGFAAKAVGYWDKEFNCYNGPLSWDPLIDDADALRLAVTLRITVEIGEVVTGVHAGHLKDISYAMHNGDPFAATRRAIVEAAAEIGRTNVSYRTGRE